MLLLSCEKIQRIPVSEAAADQAVWDQVHPKSAQREYGPEKQQRKKSIVGSTPGLAMDSTVACSK